MNQFDLFFINFQLDSERRRCLDRWANCLNSSHNDSSTQCSIRMSFLASRSILVFELSTFFFSSTKHFSSLLVARLLRQSLIVINIFFFLSTPEIFFLCLKFRSIDCHCRWRCDWRLWRETTPNDLLQSCLHMRSISCRHVMLPSRLTIRTTSMLIAIIIRSMLTTNSTTRLVRFIRERK